MQQASFDETLTLERLKDRMDKPTSGGWADTMIGFSLAYLYEHSGSLLVPIVVHGVWNSLTVMRVLTVMGD